uniref:Uncharacterized protein n=1 Tax=Pseudo-nitzschia australis TaxID=44445 RepID=A0A7S4ABG2_9STRA|mmetsp:Transcript_16628/g.34205  ORF Transcript_16628/g.34205 Transcript_16628/m.34205 type:complete len:375 (+) Transcript_16628:116-1240(+)
MTNEDIEETHLAWTKKQGYVLTGGGKAEGFYTAERGFPFLETDLPHYHLLKGDTHSVFKPVLKSPKLLVVGAWNRPLFSGGWKYSSDKEERVYNVQTNNLFIDFRVPRSREKVLGESTATSLDELSPRELQFYARQHIFAGFTVVDHEKERPVATRHHFIDWNFVGISRSRPNKWWIEVNDDISSWKESAYATDDNGQHYYFEQWDRLQNGMPEPRLALRVSPSEKRKSSTEQTEESSRKQQDGVFVLVGDHFNYVMDRTFSGNENSYNEATSLVDLVDDAIANGDLATARSYLSIEGGHGTVSNGWKLDCAIPPWNEGKDIACVGNGHLEVVGADLASCSIVFKGLNWDLYDCSFENIDQLKQFLNGNKSPNI